MKKIYVFALAILVAPVVIGQSLSGVESVEYDPINNRYLTSSDNTSIVAIAPNGALSHFGNGLTASHGMEVIGDKLYAVSGSTIRCYDLNTEQQVWSQSVSGAGFLNGMANNGVDTIWITDFIGKDIIAMDVNDPGDYSVLVSNTVETPNGIVYDGENNRCLFTTWDNTGADIKAMNLTTSSLSYVVQNSSVGKIDGIDFDDDGNWFISSWNPARITKFSNDFSSSEIITVPGLNNPADICYSTETDTLAIPGGDQVLFVGFESPVLTITEETPNRYRLYYNSGFPVIQFELADSQEATLEIFDVNGRLVFKVLEGIQPKGVQTVVLSSVGLYSGSYICRMTSTEVTFSERVVIP